MKSTFALKCLFLFKGKFFRKNWEHKTTFLWLMWYCRAQKEFAFEITSRVFSTKRVMQWHIEHKWPKAMSVWFHCITSFVLTTSDVIPNVNDFCALQYPITIWFLKFNWFLKNSENREYYNDSTESHCNTPDKFIGNYITS